MRSLCNKLQELYQLLYSRSYDILLVTETWLSDRVPNSLLDPYNQFTICRCDRYDNSGYGGVCAFIKKSLNVVEIVPSNTYSSIEVCCFDVFLCNERIRFVNVYRAPSSTDMPTVANFLSDYTKVKGHCIITGDFNCRNVNWTDLTAPYDGTEDTLLDFSVSHGFNQMVHKPTRGDSILDLIFTNEPVAIFDVNVESPFSTSDHCQVEFSVFTDNNLNEEESTNGANSCNVYDWSSANYEGMADYFLSINWCDVLSHNLTPDALWSAFCDVFNHAIDNFVSSTEVIADNQRNTRKQWYPAGIKRAIARKRCLWRQHKLKPEDANIAAAYDVAASKCKRLIQRFELRKEQKVVDSNDTGSFYNFVNRRLTCKKGVGALRKDNNEIVMSDNERANFLNEYFSSVCTTDDGKSPTIDRVVPDDVFLDSVTFTPEKVLAAIKKIKRNKASGPDGYPPLVYRNIATALATPLSLIFTSFMSVGKLPLEWTHAIVTPVYKSGDASNVANYRPISLTCVASKLMERIIVTDMLCFLREHNAISKQQHGFLQGRSTSSNLLETLSDWTLSIQNKQSVVVAYIDYAKAFDTVSHAKLLSKLSAYGITGNLYNWVSSFLHNRTQQTRVGSALSNTVNLPSGVVQGSVLGPLLFVLFINDVSKILNNDHCFCKLYADDLKLYTSLCSNDNASVLQSKLDDLYCWSITWQLNISFKKCATMCVSGSGNNNSNSNNSVSRPALCIGSNVIASVNEMKDLGVIIDNHLDFKLHINNIVARAFVRSNLIHKCFISRDVHTLLRA